MTTATVYRITPTGVNYIVHVRPVAKTVVFYGWNDAVIKSVTPMPDGMYVLEGQYDDRDFTGQSRPTVAEIVAAFEGMATDVFHEKRQRWKPVNLPPTSIWGKL